MKDSECNKNNIYRRVARLEAQTKESLNAINSLQAILDRLIATLDRRQP